MHFGAPTSIGKSMNRILVTGNASSGKTTLAITMASHAALPYIVLDEIVWQPQWKKTPAAQRLKPEATIASQTAWIVDGVPQLLLEAADTVVFIDFPRRSCL
jgi:adenylate kinase family enzyme